MRHWLRTAATVSVPLAWLACSCSAFSGDDEAVDGRDAAVSDGNADSDNADVGNAETSTSPVDAATRDGTLIDDGFELGASCEGWMGVNSATPLPAAGGHTGARSCEICVVGPAGYMAKTVPASGAGPYQALVWARADAQDGGPPSAGVTLEAYGADGGRTGYAVNGKPLTSAWQRIAAVVAPAGDVVGLKVSVSVGADGCIRVDDISVTQD